jgi:hypothetical protein
MEPLVNPLRRHAAAVVSLARTGRALGGDLADASPVPLEIVARTLRTAAFWTAVVLPFVHLPLLLVAGFTVSTTPLLVALWTFHAVVLAVGAGHDPGR